jgi:hypothetical protein
MHHDRQRPRKEQLQLTGTDLELDPLGWSTVESCLRSTVVCPKASL